jgi:hypothetical protein
LITVPPRHHKQQTRLQQADPLLTVSAGTLPPRGHPECLRTDDELAAARAANRDLIATLNRPVR